MLRMMVTGRPSTQVLGARSTRHFQRHFASAKQYDLVIVGGGPGGYVGAIKAGQLGLKVACVESRGKLGGTCLNVGCIPSKALLNSSHKYEDATKHFKEHGIIVDNVKVDLEAMMKGKTKRVNGLTSGIEGLFKKNKVDYIKGKGSFESANKISVALNDGGKTELEAKNVIIATGSEVMSLPGIEIDEEVIVSSTGALSLKKIPETMLVIGGGVIGLELGSVWSRLGAKVQVVEFTDKIAAGADVETGKEFQKILKKQGLEFKMKKKVTSAKKNANGQVDVTIEDAAGGNATNVTVDVVLCCVGRRPYTDGLGLEKIGVKTDQRGFIQIDSEFKTNVNGVRAIGDCVPGPMLAHKSEEEGIAAVEYIKTGVGHVNYDAIPSVVYTHPEVAWVGKTEEQLKEAGIKYNVGKFPMLANSRARTNADSDGFVKFLAEKGSDKILGVHMICANAGELIAESVLAVEYGASSEDVSRTCHAHPTLTEAVKEAAMMAHDKPIHF